MARVGTAKSGFTETLSRPFTVNPYTPKYKGKRIPAEKYDSAVGKDMPAWSSSLFHCCDNPDMVLCAMTGVGIFAIHGHSQDGDFQPVELSVVREERSLPVTFGIVLKGALAALYNGGCLFTCCTGAITWGECGRQRRYLRKRLQMKGGEYMFSGWLGDCTETFFCLPLTVCQEAREIEIRSRRKWNWLRGFRGVGEPMRVALFGEERLDYVLVGFKHQERDILSAQFFASNAQGAPSDGGSAGDDARSVQSRSEAEAESVGSGGGRLEAPLTVDAMTR